MITADRVPAAGPRTVHVVPLTANLTRGLWAEVPIAAEGALQPSAAQVHLGTAVSTARIGTGSGDLNVGPAAVSQIRSVLSDLVDLP